MMDTLNRPSFRHRLAAGERLIGMVMTLSDPAAVEIMAQAGFDWLWLDGEHSALGVETVQSLLRAAGDCHCLVRLPGFDEAWAKKVLEAGAEGMIFPMANTAELAERAVALTKYPPLGKRSIGVGRAQGYGARFEAYVQQANEWVCTILQIEHIQAVENLEAILAVPGVDALVIGPYDLSASLGMPGQVDAPQVLRAIEVVRGACRRAHRPLGIFAGNGERSRRALEMGFDFIAAGVDAMLLSEAASGMVAGLADLS